MTQDEFDYICMTDQVRLIDENAADYLEGDAKKLNSFYYDGDLVAVMTWDETPHGYAYWNSIWEKLNDVW